MSATKAPPHIVMLTCPGAGHVLPMAELARRLAEDHGFATTIITHSAISSPRHASAFASLPACVTMAALPAVPLDDLPADARIETRLITVVTRGLPHLRALLAELVRAHDVVAFVGDVFCAQALPLAAEQGVPPYVAFTSGLTTLAFMLRLPELDGATACAYGDLPEPLRLPGCVPLRGEDLLDTVQDRSNPAYALLVEMTRHLAFADGFVVNTFGGMEHEAIAAFQELSDHGVYPPVYAVGPFLRACAEDAQGHGCLRWLDDQPDGSVLYVCFGSGGTLSVEQTAELASGLEASGQRFLWVVRFPSDKDSSADFFGAARHGGDDDDPLRLLPEGFGERTKGVGLCVPTWAPQVEVLHHRAVGGFLSHCGWNSTIEAIDAGVPMVAWPLFAEQRTNAMMLEKAGMALRPGPASPKGRLVSRDEVAAVAAELMAGEKGKVARKKAKDMQMAAAEALAPEGPSRRALAAIVDKWKQGAHVGNGTANGTTAL